MCIICGIRYNNTSSSPALRMEPWPWSADGFSDDHAQQPMTVDGLPIPSFGNGPLTDHTPGSPLPTFTYDQIIRALRTSGISEDTSTAVANDHVTDQRTWSWGTAGDIVYEVDAGSMSAYERSRIDLAFEVWDDLINVNIRNDQTSGDPGGPTRFTTVRYDSTAANGGRAFYSIDTAVTNSNNNGYGTTDNTINTGTFNLGRNFNGGEFDGRDAAGVADNGVHDLTLFARRGFETMLHEAGHGLGLSHPGYYNNGHVTVAAGVRFDQDNRRNTIMSYRTEGDGADSNADWNGLFAATPMIYDIAAAQTMYGADPNTRTGATTYGFNNNSGRPVFDFSKELGSVFAIYDAGGIDTLDASQFTGNSVINLWPGTISSIGQAGGNAGDAMIENIGIAFNTVIENVIGGSGNDTLWGNDASNVIDQGLGGGEARGFGGQDIFIAGPGGETFYGGDGIDTIDYSRSNAGVDVVYGKVGGGWGNADALLEVENIIGTGFDDTAYMDSADNTLEGRGGHDTLDGGGGIDGLYGGFGNDVLTGGHGRWVGDLYFAGDWIDGGDGFDIAAFNTAVTIDLRPGGVHGGEAQADTFISIEQFNGSPERDFFWGNTFNNWFQGRGEGDYINGGAGNDTASYADRNSGINVTMWWNDLSPGDENRHPNELAGRTDGKIQPHEGTWIDTLISIENIEGTNFADDFEGDERANTFWGLGGNDSFEGDAGGTPQGSWDDMYGGSGNDTFVVGPNDYANGGLDNDVATFVGGALFLDFINFNMTVGGTAIHVQDIETYIGTADVDQVYGAGHGETISLGAGNDTLGGGEGDDFLYTDLGVDWMDGGGGYDTMVFHKAMVADWQSGVLDADIVSDSWLAWEAIQGSAGNDRIRTNSWGFAVELRGGAGDDVLATGVAGVVNDILKGEDGNDTLNGGAGTDLMDGGIGNDTFVVDRASDQVIEADLQGIDTVESAVSFSLGGARFVEHLTLTGSAASNGTGNGLANTLTGNGVANLLRGGGGRDVLDGGLGVDTADFRDQTASVVLALNGATSAVARVGAADNLADTVPDDDDAVRNVENVYGGSANDVLTGDGLANLLFGHTGNDLLKGAGGRDVLDGGEGVDTADYRDQSVAVTLTLSETSLARVSLGAAYEDTVRNVENVYGGSADDRLAGDGLANTIMGNVGNDRLSGGGGNDALFGGAGLDVLTGGTERDQFVFNTALSATTNVDTITDFSHADDTIRLSKSAFGALSGQATNSYLTANMLADYNVAGDANDHILYRHIDGSDADTLKDMVALYYDANGGSHTDAILFAKLTGQASMTLMADDFFVIA